ncbi:nuclear transport factor 2 family protein [Marinobacter fonticola]|uniref:nuclear transport factor 2 family protein n=1 Tax=Marinobacter fonticola TaxID=2603215 RepID=UPI0011E662ED|nr:nuclear transport factor 2 family protein [Marinobacter fonticola]
MSESVEPCLKRFQALFNRMSADQLGELSSVYASNVRFTDPFVSIQGLDELTEYFGGAYANVISCGFTFDEPMGSDIDICLPWTMTLRHRRIRRGSPVTVEGISHLRIVDDRVAFHRDYFDAGQLLYENVPVLGTAVRWLRKYAA